MFPPLRIYLSGRYRDRRFYRAIRGVLNQQHRVVSSWLDEGDEHPPESVGDRRIAALDITDLLETDLLICDTRFSFSHHSGGGREFERGFAYARGARLWRVGPCRQPFHFLDEQVWEDWPSAIRALGCVVDWAGLGESESVDGGSKGKGGDT